MSRRAQAFICLVLMIAAALPAPTARAESAAPPFDLALLMAHFRTVKSGSARFTERRYLHVLNTPLDDSGVLIYEAPDKLQKQTLQPNQQNMVVERDTVTITGEGKTQTLSLVDYPQLSAFIEGIRATLAGDAATLQRIYTTQLSGNMGAWTLTLVPRDAAMQAIVTSITISGSDASIREVKTAEHDGDHTDMTIFEGDR